ncbi:MAG: hypothetical protein JRN39_06420 [Nitrososphaerota archaeon]|nr:hypothetical protein [Nitrososphaerota archaeon]MDG6940018.1 hypothetical protein [Nitrososphaerota archaeon]
MSADGDETRCAECGREFATRAALKQHVADKHRGARSWGRRKRSRARVAALLFAIAFIAGTAALIDYAVSTRNEGTYGQFPFPCAGSLPLRIHIHPYLVINIEGSNVTIPADIGLTGSCTEPLHTHDASGVIHVESPTMQNYTLADFFAVWKATYGTVSVNGTDRPIVFNSTDIFGYTVDGNHTLVVLVDGIPSNQSSSLNLNALDYCNATNSVVPSSPCYATAQGSPYWDNLQYPYQTGQTIEIMYEQTNSST